MNDVSLTTALRSLIVMLEKEQFDYAIGGALAFAVWAVPRATADIDLNIWCEAEAIEKTMTRLYASGVSGPELALAIKQATDDGVAYVFWRGVRLDVFVPSIPFYDEARRTRVRAAIPEIGDAWVLSKEALCVFKMLFYRMKDLLDVAKLVSVQGTALDRAYVRSQLVDMLGPDDERVRKFDEMT